MENGIVYNDFITVAICNTSSFLILFCRDISNNKLQHFDERILDGLKNLQIL